MKKNPAKDIQVPEKKLFVTIDTTGMSVSRSISAHEADEYREREKVVQTISFEIGIMGGLTFSKVEYTHKML